MPSPRPRLRLDIAQGGLWHAVPVAVASLALFVVQAGPLAAQSEPLGNGVDIVVTTSVLGSVVRDLVDDRANVTVLMANGVDPHDWAPSAQDLEAVYAADLVVANGLGLEEGLQDALGQAEAEGTPIFEATDHIDVRELGEAAHGQEAEAGHAPADSPAPEASPAAAVGEGHDHGAEDPHFWVDPVSMIAVVEALAPVIGELGVDVSDREADLVARLESLDAQVRSRLAVIPAGARKLVTGHESMGYFAARYDLELVGAVIPGLSSQGEVSARAMADLAEQIRDAGVRVIFAEAGTPRSVADAIASETGAGVVELPSHRLPDDGSYVTFISGIADIVAEALS
ncbi:MAG TPA: metal ABC transporter substrate-binding protein [Candidatus Deferrimicrobium sp.]|nr:metal ABC transporter substrate-binding protein [Candidatus Deferrimicrobium sp.]